MNHSATAASMKIAHTNLEENDLVLRKHHPYPLKPVAEKSIPKKDETPASIGDMFKGSMKSFEAKLSAARHSQYDRSVIMEELFQNLRGPGDDSVSLQQEKANTLKFMYEKYMM